MSDEGARVGRRGEATDAGLAGIGTDLVDVDRFRRVLERTPGVADRVFTADERAAVARRRDPVPGLAARFAAKEAVLKALGRGIFEIPLRQIEIVTLDSGAPVVVLHDAAAAVAAGAGVATVLVSLTHTDHQAHAMAAALRP